MKAHKNSLSLILMVSSISLLVALQVFWLRKEYQSAGDNFKKETNLIFRNTLFGIMDSLFMTRVEYTHGNDSIAKEFLLHKPRGRHFRRVSGGKESDSIISFFDLKEKKARIEIFGSSEMEGDSIKNIINPIIKSFDGKTGPKSSFIIRMAPDTLDVDTIALKFEGQLLDVGRMVSFDIIKDEHDGKMPYMDSSAFTTDFVRISPETRYAASFRNIPPLLLKEIVPQMLFSAFLTVLTTLAFVVLYRNMLLQQRLMDQKNEFISNVSHELKTPVATVSVALEALKNFNALEDPKLTKEYLDIAQSELNRLSTMTDKILKTAIYDSKGIEFESENVNLQNLIKQVASSMRMVWEKQKVEVSFRFVGSDFKLLGSSIHLGNVIYNLLDNAVKYSPPPAHILVSLQEEAHQYILKVQDQGIGISKEYQRKVFEKFFRVPHGDTHNIKGYGLGLSYVANVIKAHHGKITIESEKSQGSTFIIILPKGHVKS